MKIIEAADYNDFEKAIAPLWAEQNAAAGISAEKRLWAFTLENDEQRVIGGIGGHIRWDWMYIQHLIVAQDLRGKGHGQALLYKAERLARELGLTGIYLTTMTYQVPGFYQAAGFEVMSTIHDMPVGAGMVTLAKKL